MPEPRIRSAQVVLPCRDVPATLAFLTGELGFRVERITPADAPVLAVVSGHGCTLRLERCDRDAAMTLHLVGDHPLPAGLRDGPGGLVVRFEHPAAHAPFVPAFVLTRAGNEAFHPGRAGMSYRDLIPGRLGGRYIASHIRIPEGGPVADWVHHHDVRFQMIYCRAGWVRVVYEDQGPPFVLEAGDCVLQPPGIRHRVLESSPGLEVIEIGTPAEHDTHADHELALPNEGLRPAREFGGQRFVRHVASRAAWRPEPAPGVAARDTGIADATRGVATVRVLRLASGASHALDPDGAELRFLYLLEGRLDLRGASIGAHALEPDDACTLPPGAGAVLEAGSSPIELLEVRVQGPR